MNYVVSHWYAPCCNPPSLRMEALVRVLSGRDGTGNVTVVTGTPCYPHGKILPHGDVGRYGERIVHLWEWSMPFSVQ